MKKRTEIIVCPHCGREYLPAEIFVPNGFFGRPKNIEKDYTGRIMDYSGDSMDLSESFICDKCEKKFNIATKIQFFTSPADGSEFNEESTVSLKRCSLVLGD